LSDLAAITNAVTPSFSLNETDSTDIRVLADKFLGEYGIIVQARFDGEQEFQDVSRITIKVLPKSIADGYCFEIDKTYFLVKPTDSGKITNRCAVNPIDAFLPALSLQNPKASLDTENLQLFPLQQFKWTTGLEGTLGPELGKPRLFTEHLDAPTSNENGQPPKIDMIAVLTQAALPCAALISKPQIFPICLYLSVSSAITQAIGPEKVDQTCAQCKLSGFYAAPEPQPLLLGTTLQSVQIKGITFDDGGWIAFNENRIHIPKMGPPPTGNEQTSTTSTQGNQSNNFSNQTNPGIQQMGGSGGWMEAVQLFSSLLDSSGNTQCNAISILLGQCSNYIQLGTDSCTGFQTESTNCNALPASQEINNNSALLPGSMGGYCVNIEPAPIDVTDKFKTGQNTYQLFECNKFNDGFAEFTLEINDSVSQQKTSQQVSFSPLKDTVVEAGTASTDLQLYLNQSPPDAFLSLAVTNDSQGKIASWMQEDKKIKAMYFDDSTIPLAEKTFEIKNLEIEGEEYATLTITDLVSETQPPMLDIIFVVDSSPTMGAEKAALCQKMDLIDSQLKSQGIDAVSKAYAIGGTDIALSCAIESADWGESQVSADATPHDAKKAWGPALQDAIAKTLWREGAKRAAVIVADDGVLGNSAQNQQEPSQPQGTQPITPEVPLEN
ncbi:MAG: hypothetical protein AABW85_00175, partial [archaeon]